MYDATPAAARSRMTANAMKSLEPPLLAAA